MNTTKIAQLDPADIKAIIPLVKHLNPNIADELLRERQLKMFEYPTYICFGIFLNSQLIGVSSGWISERLYSGKQIEIDNVIIDPSFQSEGYGLQLLKHIEKWATDKNCKTVELNAYVQNSMAHKFYFREGYKILGFHFQKTF